MAKKERGIKKVLKKIFSNKAKVSIAPTNSEVSNIKQEKPKLTKEEAELEKLREQAAKIREQNVEKAYNGYIPPIPTPGYFGNDMAEYKKELQRIIIEEGKQVQERRTIREEIGQAQEQMNKHKNSKTITIKNFKISKPFQEGRTSKANRGEPSRTKNKTGLTKD